MRIIIIINKNLVRELKQQRKMTVMVIRIAVGASRNVPEGLERGIEQVEIRGRIETIQTAMLLRTTKLLRRVLESGGDLLSLRLQWNLTSKRSCEKPAKSKTIIKSDKFNLSPPLFFFFFFCHKECIFSPMNNYFIQKLRTETLPTTEIRVS